MKNQKTMFLQVRLFIFNGVISEGRAKICFALLTLWSKCHLRRAFLELQPDWRGLSDVGITFALVIDQG